MYTELKKVRLNRRDRSILADEEKKNGATGKIKKTGFVAKFARLLILGGAALLIFIYFFVRFIMTENESKAGWAPDIVVMGDSIFAYSTDETSVANILSLKMNVEVADISFGGSCMCYIDKDALMGNTTDAFCMAALTQAIVNEDYRYQEGAHVRINATSYFDERIELLKSIDFSEVDILIMDHLLNDYQIAVPVDCGSDIYDEYTYEGAFRSVVTQLKEAYPQLRIIIVAPPKTWYYDEMLTSEQVDYGEGIITQYIQKQKELAEELGVEWVSLYDLYDETIEENPKVLINSDGTVGDECSVFTEDRVHPNEFAREIIAERIFEYLASGE